MIDIKYMYTTPMYFTYKMDNMLWPCFFLFAVLGVAENSDYKISMVTSDDQANSPVVFRHPESPVWDDDTQSLLFVDALDQRVHRLWYYSGKIDSRQFEYGQVNVVTRVANSKRLLVAVRSALYLLDWDVPGDAALRLLTQLDTGLPDNILNEGKADAMGRFWGGTKGPQSGDEVQPDKATLYSVEQATFIKPIIKLRPVTISNGLAWSPNNSIFYYIDSPTKKIEAFDFDLLSGELSNRRTILDITNYGYHDAIPDGMTVDNDGNLWVALMFGGTVLQINPNTQRVMKEIKLPVSRTTSLCWGGPNLDELFVTTSREHSDLRLEPYAGAIYIITGTGCRGLPNHKFRFDNADKY